MVHLVLDFRLDSPGFEISALRSSLVTFESQLDLLRSRRADEVKQFISTLDMDSDDGRAEAGLAYQELEWEVDHTYPRVYRGGLLILIWAAYESGIQEVAEFISEKMPVRLTLADLRGRTTLERATKYYPEVLKFDLFSSAKSHGQLREIELVRNAFAHGNGRLGNASVRSRKVLESMVVSGRLKEWLDIVTPTKEFVQWSLAVVEAELINLVDRAKAWDDARSNHGPHSAITCRRSGAVPAFADDRLARRPRTPDPCVVRPRHPSSGCT